MDIQYRGRGTGLGYKWNTNYSYVVPDYVKIRKELSQLQKDYNNKGVPVKVSYGKGTLNRSGHGVIRLQSNDVDQAKDALRLVHNITSVGVHDIGIIDIFIADMLGGRKDMIERSDGSCPQWSRTECAKTYCDYRDELLNKSLEDELDQYILTALDRLSWGGESMEDLGEGVDEGNVKDLENFMRSRLSIRKVPEGKEADLRKGRRINRGYINNVSLKPLMRKTEEILIKKKVLVIVDASGSMGCYYETADGNRRAASISSAEFLYALEDTEFFHVDHFFTSSRTIWTSQKRKYYDRGGSEGFEYLEMRLSDMGAKINKYDFVFVLSDLDIPDKQMRALKRLIEPSAHMIFAFAGDSSYNHITSSYPSLVVKQIKGPHDAVNHLMGFMI